MGIGGALLGTAKAIISADNTQFLKATRAAERRLDAFGRRARTLGAMMTGFLTLPLILFGRHAVDTIRQFDTFSNEVSALTRKAGDSILTVTTNMKLLNAQAKELGLTTRFSASEAASAQAFLARTGFEVQQIFQAMPGVLNLASAANLDLGRTADIASNILKAFRIDAAKMDAVGNILATVFSNTNVNLEQMGDAMKLSAGSAQALGVPLGEAAAVIGLIGDAGLQGTIAGTSFNNFLLGLLSTSPKATNAIAAMGVEFLGAGNKIRSLTTILKELDQEGFSILKASEAFGRRGVRFLAALTGRGAEMKNLMDTIVQGQQGIGSAARIAEDQLKGLVGALFEMRSAIEGAILALADAGLRELLIGGSRMIRDWARAFVDLEAPLQRIIGLVLALTAAMGALTFVIGTLTLAAPILTGIATLGIPATAALAVLSGLGGMAVVGVVMKKIAASMEEAKDAASDYVPALKDVKDGLDALATIKTTDLGGLKPVEIAAEIGRIERELQKRGVQPQAARGIDLDVVRAGSEFPSLPGVGRGTNAEIEETITLVARLQFLLAQHEKLPEDTKNMKITVDVSSLIDGLGTVDEATREQLVRATQLKQLKEVFNEVAVSVADSISEINARQKVAGDSFDDAAARAKVYEDALVRLEQEGFSQFADSQSEDVKTILGNIREWQESYLRLQTVLGNTEAQEDLARIEEKVQKALAKSVEGFDEYDRALLQMNIELDKLAKDAGPAALETIENLREAWTGMLRDRQAGASDEGVAKEAQDIIQALERETRNIGLTDLESKFVGLMDTFDDLREQFPRSEAEIERWRKTAVAAFDEFREKSELAERTFNLGEKVSSSLAEITTGILRGTRDFGSAMEAMADIGFSIWSEMLQSWIKEKLDFDVVLQENFLTDIPALLKRGGAAAKEAFSGAFSGMGSGPGASVKGTQKNVDGATDAFGKVVDGVEDQTQGFGKEFMGTWDSIFDSIGSGIKHLATGVSGFIGQILASIALLAGGGNKTQKGLAIASLVVSGVGSILGAVAGGIRAANAPTSPTGPQGGLSNNEFGRVLNGTILSQPGLLESAPTVRDISVPAPGAFGGRGEASTINITNNTPARISAAESFLGDRRQVDVLVEVVDARLAERTASGRGSFQQAQRQVYGSTRVGERF